MTQEERFEDKRIIMLERHLTLYKGMGHLMSEYRHLANKPITKVLIYEIEQLLSIFLKEHDIKAKILVWRMDGRVVICGATFEDEAVWAAMQKPPLG